LADLTTEKVLKTITLPGAALSLVFTADGNELLVGGYDRMLIRCSIPDGKVVHKYVDKAPQIFGILPSAEGNFATLTREPALRIWELSTPKEVKWAAFPVPLGQQLLRLSWNGRILATVDAKRTLRFFDTQSAKLLSSIDNAFANAEETESVQISLDGTRALALTAGHNGSKVVVWEIATGKSLRELDVKGLATAAGFTANGKSVITAPQRGVGVPDSTNKLGVWNLSTGSGSEMAVGSVSLRERNTSMRLWCRETLALKQIEPSPDGRLLALIEESKSTDRHGGTLYAYSVMLVDLASGIELTSFFPDTPPYRLWFYGLAYDKPGRFPVSWSADSKFLAYAGTSLIVTDLANSKLHESSSRFCTHTGPINALHWLPDGSLITGSDNGSMLLWQPPQIPPPN
jgi:WD40 repeat protein